jgi:hypothetical protein
LPAWEIDSIAPPSTRAAILALILRMLSIFSFLSQSLALNQYITSLTNPPLRLCGSSKQVTLLDWLKRKIRITPTLEDET